MTGLTDLTDLRDLQHELRTPLNAVLGFSMLIRSHAADALSPVALNWLAQIENAGQLMLSLIERLGAQADGRPSVHTRSDLRRSVGDAVQMLRFAAQQAGVELVLDAGEGEPLMAPGGETAQRQVLINVVGNAIKYTPAGGRVTVLLRAPLPGSRHAVVSVRDTGIGMSSEQCARLFRAYDRLGREREPGASGTGLGLFLTKRLMESIGGSLDVASRLGAGTIVSLHVPLSDAPQAAPEAVAP